MKSLRIFEPIFVFHFVLCFAQALLSLIFLTHCKLLLFFLYKLQEVLDHKQLRGLWGFILGGLIVLEHDFELIVGLRGEVGRLEMVHFRELKFISLSHPVS